MQRCIETGKHTGFVLGSVETPKEIVEKKERTQ